MEEIATFLLEPQAFSQSRTRVHIQINRAHAPSVREFLSVEERARRDEAQEKGSMRKSSKAPPRRQN